MMNNGLKGYGRKRSRPNVRYRMGSRMNVKNLSGSPVFEPRFEPGTSRILKQLCQAIGGDVCCYSVETFQGRIQFGRPKSG